MPCGAAVGGAPLMPCGAAAGGAPLMPCGAAVAPIRLRRGSRCIKTLYPAQKCTEDDC